MVSHLTEFASKLRSEKVKPLVQTDRTLREVHDTVTTMLKQLANEPSVGLYFVQQHVHTAVPGIVSMKVQMKSSSQEVGYITEDVKDALNSVRSMKEVGPAVIERMNKNLDFSFSHLATLRPKRDDPSDSLAASGEPEDRFLLDPSAQQTTSPRRPSLSSEQQVNVESEVGAQSQAKTLPPRGFQSLPAFFKEDLFGRPTAAGDYSGYVKNVFGTAFQRASNATVDNFVKWNAYSKDSGSVSNRVDRESHLDVKSGEDATISLDVVSQDVPNDASITSATDVNQSHEENPSSKEMGLVPRDDEGIQSFGSGSSSLSFRGVADYGNPGRYLRSMFGSTKPGNGEGSGRLNEAKNSIKASNSFLERAWSSGPSKVVSAFYRNDESKESRSGKGANDDSLIANPDAADSEPKEEIQRFLEAEEASNATFAAEKAAELEEWLQDAEDKEAGAE